MYGYHTSMTEAMRLKLREERGHSFFIYDTEIQACIYKFDSKQYAMGQLQIHHNTLDACLSDQSLYLDRFIFSHTQLTTYPLESYISLDELILLFGEVRTIYKPHQPASKAFTVENVLNPQLSGTFQSINDFVSKHGGDRSTIRHYLNGNKPAGSLYRKQWKFTLSKRS